MACEVAIYRLSLCVETEATVTLGPQSASAIFDAIEIIDIVW